MAYSIISRTTIHTIRARDDGRRMDVPSGHIGRHSTQMLVAGPDPVQRAKVPGIRRNTGRPEVGVVVVGSLGWVNNTNEWILLIGARREGGGGFSVVVGNRYDAIITNCLESEQVQKVRHIQHVLGSDR
jgi:hypothetical protein